MKNVLIICDTFPPQSFVGGLRPAMFTRYLTKFNWNPWVLTRDFTPEDPRYDEKMPVDLPSNIHHQICKVKYSLQDEQNYLQARNIFHKARDLFYPEYSSPPGLFFAVKNASKYMMGKIKFDLIFATVPDQWELTLGAFLAKKYNTPLVADFRDILEQEIGLNRPVRQKLQIVRFSIRRYLTTRYAAQITTVSEFHQITLQRKLKRKTSIVYNGYDNAEFKPIHLLQEAGSPFRIIYLGRILNTWYQNPQNLFTAIDQLISEKQISESDISVEFNGTDKEKLELLLLDLKHPNFIKFKDRILYAEVPQKMNEAQMLLLLTNRGRNGILTTKFFEYAGVKKPILCIPGDEGELDYLINQYNLGYSIGSVLTLKEKLVEWIKSFRMGSFPEHVSSNIEFFTRENQTKILSEIFDKVINRKSK
jgi:glycosyltransferase involved in cell wall biosynthesis